MSVSAAVVIPLYNSEDWIGRTIRSALDQDLPGLQVIVVDDGSSDTSAERVREFGDRVVLETGPNRGACHARNRGLDIARARGAKYVLFLDADDYFEGPILPGAVRVAEAHGADMVLSDMHLEYADGHREIRHRYEGRIAPIEFYEGWMKGDYVNPSAVLWRAEFVDQVGRWDESLARAQDFDVTLRAMFHDPVIWKNDEGAAIHARVNAGSITTNVSLRALDSRWRVVSGLARRARGTAFERVNPLLYNEIYRIARDAFRAGEIGLGRELVRFLKAEGYRRHPGTRSHRIAASVLGLEWKTRLWRGQANPFGRKTPAP